MGGLFARNARRYPDVMNAMSMPAAPAPRSVGLREVGQRAGEIYREVESSGVPVTVTDDGRPIAQQIDVGLDPPRSGVDSGAEGRHGVLGGGRWQTAVGDNRAFDARRTAVGARGGFPDPVASSGHARSPDRTPAPTSVTPGFDDHPGTGRSIPPHHPTATGSGTSVIP